LGDFYDPANNWDCKFEKSYSYYFEDRIRRPLVSLKPLTLVTPPSAAKEVQESIVRLLRRTLEEAERGEIDTVLIIASMPNGEWIDRASDTLKFSEAIGRLEITKLDWIKRHMEGDC
jgi:hypothetical protein